MSAQAEFTSNIKLLAYGGCFLTDRVTVILGKLPAKIGKMKINGFVKIDRVYAEVVIEETDYLADIITGAIYKDGKRADGLKTLNLESSVKVTRKEASKWVSEAVKRTVTTSKDLF